MTTIHATPAPVVPAPRPTQAPLQLRPLRLRLRATGPGGRAEGRVDGAWWPYTDDLLTELGPLLAGMAGRDHLVHRISYSLGAWQPVPHKAHIAGTLVRLGGYTTQSPAVIHLLDASGTPPVVVVVIPPGTAADSARAALELAVTSTVLDAAAILKATAAPPCSRTTEPHRSSSLTRELRNAVPRCSLLASSVLAAAVMLVVGAAGPAAAESPGTTFGSHVSSCAAASPGFSGQHNPAHHRGPHAHSMDDMHG